MIHRGWARWAAALLVAGGVTVGSMGAAVAAVPTPEAGTSTTAVPGVTVLPAAQTVPEGGRAAFTALFPSGFTGPSPVVIRWETSARRSGPWAGIGAAGASRLPVTAGAGIDGHLFRAVVTAGGESSVSAPVVLHVTPAPRRTGAPASTGAVASCPPAAPAVVTGPDAPCVAREPLAPTPTPTPTPVPTSAGAPPAAPPYGTVGRLVLPRGQEQSATGHQFVPGTRVAVSLEPDGTDLGTYTVAPDGTVALRFATTLLSPGSHTVVWTPV